MGKWGIYKGDYLQDQRTGQGIYAWPDGSYYEGSFLNGKDMEMEFLVLQMEPNMKAGGSMTKGMDKDL